MTKENGMAARDLLGGLLAVLTFELGDTGCLTLKCDESRGERRIETWLAGALDSGLADFVLPGLPHSDGDLRRFQPSLPWRGACDLLIYHQDGTVSAVEIKDGGQGMPAVQRGIGQVTCVAVHLNPSVRIRRVVAWTPMSKPEDNITMTEACRECGVVPIILPSDDQIRRYRALMVDMILQGAAKIMKEA